MSPLRPLALLLLTAVICANSAFSAANTGGDLRSSERQAIALWASQILRAVDEDQAVASQGWLAGRPLNKRNSELINSLLGLPKILRGPLLGLPKVCANVKDLTRYEGNSRLLYEDLLQSDLLHPDCRHFLSRLTLVH